MEFQTPSTLISLIGSFVVTVMLLSIDCEAAQKDDFLNRHNYWRGKVNPTAADMQTMTWDTALEALALKWAKRCDFNHPASNTEWGGLGQNLFITSATSLNATKAVDAWDNEKNDYTYSTLACSRVCGHYTQVVWASSTKLGCSALRCSSMTGTSLRGALWNVVCQYKPPGNYRGTKPYQSGTPCSKCPDTMKFCVNNQCSVKAGGGRNFAASHVLQIAGIFTYAAFNLLLSNAFY